MLSPRLRQFVRDAYGVPYYDIKGVLHQAALKHGEPFQCSMPTGDTTLFKERTV